MHIYFVNVVNGNDLSCDNDEVLRSPLCETKVWGDSTFDIRLK